MYIVEHLKTKGLIEQERHPDFGAPGTVGYRLTFNGSARFEERRRSLPASRIAFMAMGYGNEHVDRAFAEFIGAVGQTGFELRRLDQKPKAGLIDLRMRVEIRSAKFLVADLTDENRGAYWGAGFAEGLGKNVDCTCEASKFDAAKTHFDTEHLLTVSSTQSGRCSAADGDIYAASNWTASVGKSFRIADFSSSSTGATLAASHMISQICQRFCSLSDFANTDLPQESHFPRPPRTTTPWQFHNHCRPENRPNGISTSPEARSPLPPTAVNALSTISGSREMPEASANNALNPAGV